MALTLIAPKNSIESGVVVPEKPKAPLSRVKAKSFMSDKERKLLAIDKVLHTITKLLIHDKTPPGKDSNELPLAFAVPSMENMRTSTAISRDLESLHWSLVIPEEEFIFANSQIQEYLFERLLLPERYEGMISQEDIDHKLKRTYQLLYLAQKTGVDPPSTTTLELETVRKNILQLRAPIIRDILTIPLRIRAPYWNALNRYLKEPTTKNVIIFSQQYVSGKLLMDMLRVLKVIFEQVRERVELSS